MNQQAMILTLKNLNLAESLLDDGYTAQDLLDENEHLFNRFGYLILVRTVLDDGFAALTSVTAEGLFIGNFKPIAELSDYKFVDVVQI